jgi:hypothetical protein
VVPYLRLARGVLVRLYATFPGPERQDRRASSGHANTDANTDPDAHAHANTEPDTYANTEPDAHANTFFNDTATTEIYTHANTDTDTHAHAYAYTYTYTHAHACAYTHAHAQTFAIGSADGQPNRFA